PNAGNSAGDNDVDAGLVSIRSPYFTLPADGSIEMSYAYFFSHRDNSSSDDYFRFKLVDNNGVTLLALQDLQGADTDRPAVWTTESNVSLNAFLGMNVALQAEAADEATGSLVEAGLDAIVILHTPVNNDADNDGIENGADNCVNTANNNQLNHDGDGEGNACDSDDDNDGLTDAEEAQYGTDPTLVDSDADSLSDYDEVYSYNTNPNAADSDGDGYSDAEEIAVGRDPNQFDAHIPLPGWALLLLATALGYFATRRQHRRLP
ncbi:MAG: hypothetical protein HKO60_06770, partial [Pseudomonadales bacterium]|nr:hypothetical protein [Pseudomonadales bacterium]